MNEVNRFKSEVAKNIESLHADSDLQALSCIWIRETEPYKYS